MKPIGSYGIDAGLIYSLHKGGELKNTEQAETAVVRSLEQSLGNLSQAVAEVATHPELSDQVKQYLLEMVRAIIERAEVDREKADNINRDAIINEIDEISTNFGEGSSSDPKID